MEELLKNVQARLKMDDVEFNSYLSDVTHTTRILEEEKIEFQPDFRLVFYAHMVSLAKRLKENISLDCGDDCPEDELDKEVDRMEIILAGIQLQLAIDMQKESKK